MRSPFRGSFEIAFSCLKTGFSYLEMNNIYECWRKNHCNPSMRFAWVNPWRTALLTRFPVYTSPHEKGQVEIVDFKEVDVAIPNVSNPEILIMSSYALTTSSSQSSRANEQAAMYEKVQTYNRRSQKIKYGKPITFINVIDGGGWIERKNDLLKMWVDCDYCFCNFDIKEVGTVLKFHFSL